MKNLILWAIFLSSPVWSVTDTQISMKPNRAYMQFFLKDYLKWHETRFKSDFHDLNLTGGDLFLKRALTFIDHWKISKDSTIDQILIGESFINGERHYNYRLYLHPELHHDPFLRQKFTDKSPLLMEWDNKGKVCFIFKVHISEISWTHIPREKTASYFEHRCQNKGVFSTSFISMETNESMEWKNPFPGTNREVRTYSQEGLESIFYNERFTHIGRIPPKHHFYINSHGEKSLLPFDKYSVSKDGSLTIYYP